MLHETWVCSPGWLPGYAAPHALDFQTPALAQGRPVIAVQSGVHHLPGSHGGDGGGHAAGVPQGQPEACVRPTYLSSLKGLPADVPQGRPKACVRPDHSRWLLISVLTATVAVASALGPCSHRVHAHGLLRKGLETVVTIAHNLHRAQHLQVCRLKAGAAVHTCP